jgi:hypothetical protein
LQAHIAGVGEHGCQLLDAWNARLAVDADASLKKRVPVQAKLFYDADIIAEEVFIAWYAPQCVYAL